jgi:phosphohistidine phosphatase SixA
MARFARLLLAGLLAFLPAAVHAAEETDATIAALRSGGHVLVIRHAATVPGIGDPPGFRVDDCATQRNLSEDGRRDARALGARLAAAGVAFDQVLSSRWCRCLDTARLAFGRAEAWTALDSFFDDRAREPAQTAEVRARVAAWRGAGTLVLVTHMVNIAALVGEGVAMGEAVAQARAGDAPRIRSGSDGSGAAARAVPAPLNCRSTYSSR